MPPARELRVKILRYDPSAGSPPTYAEYEVDWRPLMVVGDALEQIYEEQDGTLAFRYECRTRQCGSCVVQVDGEPRLFCMEPVGDRREIFVEPLAMLPIVRDLVTDRSAEIKPLYELAAFTAPADAPGHVREHAVAAVERAKIAEECAECLLCTAVCPAHVISDFAGPMLFNKLALLAEHPLDERDRVAEARALGVENCKTCFLCEEICPHEIPIRRFSISRLLAGSRTHLAFPSDHASGRDE